jgi:lipoprotein NlpD
MNHQRAGVLCSLIAVSVLAGCASSRPSVSRAPVEDRNAASQAPSATTVQPSVSSSPVTAATASSKPVPGNENAGKAGYYTVKPGDTIIRIALETGQNWRDVARWNAIDNPNIIEVGQVLRVVPPVTNVVATAPTATTSTAATTEVAVARPITVPSVSPNTGSPTAPRASSSASVPSPVVAAAPVLAAPTAPVTSAPAPVISAGGDEDVGWIWPTAGSVIAGFDDVKNKGLDISGKLGDPVLAAGDGRVVYAGAGLRGYGNLVILKHNNTYLTAYAHNQSLLVKEDQTVRRGQKIAEMGQSDADRVKLHFEIRRQGKPVDPTRYLPSR